MKKRAINKFLKSKNVIISSVIGVCLLAGGVSAFYVNNNSQRANIQEVQQSEETPTPSPTPEVETPAEVTTSPSVTPTPTPTPSQTPAPVVYTSEEIHNYIKQVSTDKNKLVLQTVVYKSYQKLSINDYKAIINECITYLDTKYGADAPIFTNPQRYANELVANVVNKYPN